MEYHIANPAKFHAAYPGIQGLLYIYRLYQVALNTPYVLAYYDCVSSYDIGCLADMQSIIDVLW